MPEIKKVVFTNWIDPLNPLDSENDNDDFDEDSDWEFAKAALGIPRKQFKGNVFASQIGLFPLGSNLASNQNKIFVAHTNFKLTTNHKKKVLDIEGIEGWDELTPYRFKIMIGWLFNNDDIKNTIRHILCDTPKETSKNYLSNSANISFKYWAKVGLKNGKNEVVSGNTQQEIQNKLSLRKDVAIILECSWKPNKSIANEAAINE